jgi:hypothetical protein
MFLGIVQGTKCPFNDGVCSVRPDPVFHAIHVPEAKNERVQADASYLTNIVGIKPGKWVDVIIMWYWEVGSNKVHHFVVTYAESDMILRRRPTSDHYSVSRL